MANSPNARAINCSLTLVSGLAIPPPFSLAALTPTSLILAIPSDGFMEREGIVRSGYEIATNAARLSHCKPSQAEQYRAQYQEQVRRLYAGVAPA